LRNDQRNNHISIKLRYLLGGGWESLEALDWNSVGFNFYTDHDIRDDVLHLKRGLIRLDGSIVWRARANDSDVLLGILINELLYEASQAASINPSLHKRVVNLIRTQGLVAEKRQALAVLGVQLSDAELKNLVDRRKLERPMFRYGVRVVDEAWVALIKNAADVSSVVQSLEKWSNAIGKSE
jgi:hypothetical protein